MIAADLPRPLPTFEKVDSIATITTVDIPTELITAWRGVYRVSISPLLQRKETSLRQYLEYYLQPTFRPLEQKRTFKYNPTAIYRWSEKLASSINQPTVEPILKIENNRVTEFTPPQNGRELDRFNSTIQIIEALQQGEKTVPLVVKTTLPKTPLAKLNDFGITELIGRGESKFSGSPKNRRHNIRVGTERMKGVLIKPGEEFSFNQYLGPVDAESGFLPELVIRADKGTVPEFGGGLCQVSSTVFRAAMHAGLKINERRNHSYAVQYYAPQGTDATIYPGAADLRFTNDTGNYILIWPKFKTNDYLIFDFYGTRDGRQVVLDQPIQWDKKTDGSMKASWSRTVTDRFGVSKTDKYTSVYKPPALFHKTDEFVTVNTGSSSVGGTPVNNEAPAVQPEKQTTTPTT